MSTGLLENCICIANDLTSGSPRIGLDRRGRSAFSPSLLFWVCKKLLGVIRRDSFAMGQSHVTIIRLLQYVHSCLCITTL